MDIEECNDALSYFRKGVNKTESEKEKEEKEKKRELDEQKFLF